MQTRALRQPEPRPPLLPRYRRPYTFADLLDFTIQVFRRLWLGLAGIITLSWLIGLLLAGIVGALLFAGLAAAGGPASLEVVARLEGGDPAAVAVVAVAVLLAVFLLSLLFGAPFLAAGAAATRVTERLLRGEPHGSILRAFWRGFRFVPALLVSGLVLSLALLLLAILAVPLFVLGVFGLLGGLVALIAVIVWAASPGARRPWLKWLLILATPFGLPLYFGVRWSLWLQAVALEGVGPLEALRRSGELVRGSWFRVVGIWVAVSLITSLLQAIPGAFVGLVVLAFVGVAEDAGEWVGVALNVANWAASLIGGALFGALPFIAGTLLFLDLRNRHEGADLAERLEAQEAAPSTRPGLSPSV